MFFDNIECYYEILYSRTGSDIFLLNLGFGADFFYVLLMLAKLLSSGLENFYLVKFYNGNKIFLFMIAAFYANTNFKPVLMELFFCDVKHE